MKVIYQGNSLLEGEKLLELLFRPSGVIACDIETISLTNKTIIGFGIAVSPTDAFYIPVFPDTSEILAPVYLLLTRPDITKYYHNGNFDIIGLRDFANEHGFDSYEDMFHSQTDECPVKRLMLIDGATKKYKNYNDINVMFGVMDEYRDPTF